MASAMCEETCCGVDRKTLVPRKAFADRSAPKSCAGADAALSTTLVPTHLTRMTFSARHTTGGGTSAAKTAAHAAPMVRRSLSATPPRWHPWHPRHQAAQPGAQGSRRRRAHQASTPPQPGFDAYGRAATVCRLCGRSLPYMAAGCDCVGWKWNESSTTTIGSPTADVLLGATGRIIRTPPPLRIRQQPAPTTSQAATSPTSR